MTIRFILDPGWCIIKPPNFQSVYFALLNPRFDEHPVIQKILSATKDKPGAFGAAMEELSASIIEELKSGEFERVQSSDQSNRRRLKFG